MSFPPPPPPTRPPPGAKQPQETLLAEAVRRRSGDRRGKLEQCRAILAFEFTLTGMREPGPVNYYIAATILQLWHLVMGERSSVPIIAPPLLVQALRELEKTWPSSSAKRPQIVDLNEASGEYQRLIDFRATDVHKYALGIAAAVCRALLRSGVAVSDICKGNGNLSENETLIAIVTHDAHAPRWAVLLEPTLACAGVLPWPHTAADLQLWGLDAQGYWNSEANPQGWTRSAEAFTTYEHPRLQAFMAVAQEVGPLWRQRTWRGSCCRGRWFVGQDVWALFQNEWHWAVVDSDDDTDDTESQKNGAVGSVRHLPTSSRGCYLRWVQGASLETLELSRRTRWAWPEQNLELMSREDADFAAAQFTAAGGGDTLDSQMDVENAAPSPRAEGSRTSEIGAPVCQSQHRQRQHWKHKKYTGAPGWRMQRCIGCNLAVTGLSSVFCCWVCEEAPGQHGPRCQRLPWLPLHRPRSLSH